VSETQDISRLQKMSIHLRYVDILTNCIQEDILELVVAENFNCEGLSKTVM